MKNFYFIVIALLLASGNIHGQSCNGTPAFAAISSTDTTICTNTNFTLTASGISTGTGITYQWQSRPTGSGGIFTDIQGATSASLTISASQYTDYRFATTCTASGMTAYSNVLTINATSAPTLGAISETHSGDTYTFSISSINNATSMYWDYGDGTTGTNNVHTYSSGGQKIVKYMATNACTTSVSSLSFIVNIPCKTVHIDSITTLTKTGVCAGTEVFVESWGHSQGFDIVYQWYARSLGSIGAFKAIPGEKSPVLAMAPDTSADYCLKVTCLSANVSTMSNVVPVKIHSMPSVVDPQSATTRAFEDAVFKIETPGDLHYRWQSQMKEDGPYYFITDNGTFEGTGTAQLTVKRAALSQSGMRFRCIINDMSGCGFKGDTSDVATLSVLDPASVADHEHKALHVSLYPNPATGQQIFIRSAIQEPRTMSAQIVNATGQTVKTQEIRLNGEASVDLMNMAPGVYRIILNDTKNNKSETLSFIKK